MAMHVNMNDKKPLSMRKKSAQLITHVTQHDIEIKRNSARPGSRYALRWHSARQMPNAHTMSTAESLNNKCFLLETDDERTDCFKEGSKSALQVRHPNKRTS